MSRADSRIIIAIVAASLLVNCNKESAAEQRRRRDAKPAIEFPAPKTPKERGKLQAKANALARKLGLPVSIDEALAKSPQLAAELAGMDEQRSFNFDYYLKFRARLEVCVGGRVSSRGGLYGVFKFDNDTRTHRATGKAGFDLRGSELSPDDTKLVLACIEKVHPGFPNRSSERMGQQATFYSGFGVRFPIREDNLYRMIRAGTVWIE